MVKINCLGGFREVGCNGVLIEGKSENIMFEYGFKIDGAASPKFPKSKPHALFITHGHLDHHGSIPSLYKKLSFPVYGTAPTKDDVELLLKDSLKIARINKVSRDFSMRDVTKTMSNWKNLKYNQKIKIGKSVIEVYDAGHVPGSAMYVLNIDKKRILYTGDFKLDPTRIVDGANINLGRIDVALMETTYSSRDHPQRSKVEKELGDLVKKVLKKGGIVLLPTFALRAAEILMVLTQQKVNAPIYLDGMAKKATEIMMSHPEFIRNSFELKKTLSKVTNLNKTEDRNKAMNTPCVIVTTGGCMDGGPIVHYLKHLYARKDCALIMTGFQIPKTAGRYLVDTGRYVTEELDLKIGMQMYQLDFSGHAGRTELLRFVSKIRPKKVICMHGDYCQRFATELKGRFGIEAIAPKNGDVVNV